MNTTIRLVMILAICVSDSWSQVVTLGLASDGAVTGWQFGIVKDPAAIHGAVSVVIIKDGLPSSDTLGAPMDEMRTPRWRWNGKAVEAREAIAVKKDRKRKLIPALIAARDRLKSARELQKEDPEAVSDDDIQALQLDVDEAKGKMK